MIKHWPFELTHYHTAIDMDQAKWDDEFLQILYDILTDGITTSTVVPAQWETEPDVIGLPKDFMLEAGACLRFGNDTREYRIHKRIGNNDHEQTLYQLDRNIEDSVVDEIVHLCGMGFEKVATEPNKISIRSKHGHDLHFRITNGNNAMELSTDNITWHNIVAKGNLGNLVCFRSFVSDGNALWVSTTSHFYVEYFVIFDDGNRWVFSTTSPNNSSGYYYAFSYSGNFSLVLVNHAGGQQNLTGSANLPQELKFWDFNAPLKSIINHSSMIVGVSESYNAEKLPLKFPGYRHCITHAGCPESQVKDEILITNCANQTGIPHMFSVNEQDWNHTVELDVKSLDLEQDFVENRFHFLRFHGPNGNGRVFTGYNFPFGSNDLYYDYVIKTGFTASTIIERLRFPTADFVHSIRARNMENANATVFGVVFPKEQWVETAPKVSTATSFNKFQYAWIRYKLKDVDYWFQSNGFKQASFGLSSFVYNGQTSHENGAVVSGSIELEGQPVKLPMHITDKRGKIAVGKHGPEYKFVLPMEEPHISLQVTPPYPYCPIIRTNIVPEPNTNQSSLQSSILSRTANNFKATSVNTITLLDFSIKENVHRDGTAIVVGKDGLISYSFDFSEYKSGRIILEFDNERPQIGSTLLMFGNYSIAYSGDDFMVVEWTKYSWMGDNEASISVNFGYGNSFEPGELQIMQPCRILSFLEYKDVIESSNWNPPDVLSDSPRLNRLTYSFDFVPMIDYYSGSYNFTVGQGEKYAILKWQSHMPNVGISFEQLAENNDVLEETSVISGSFFKLHRDCRYLRVTVTNDGGMINSVNFISI